MCNHRTCKNLRSRGAGRGVGVVVFEMYKGATPVILLGNERGGRYHGEMNLCAGKLEPHDKGCYIVAAMRELSEEFKINVPFSNFDNIFKNSKGRVRIIMLGKTPVLVGVFHGISRTPLNQEISRCNSTPGPHSQREMNFVNWINIQTRAPIDTQLPNFKISSFAQSLISKLDISRL